MSDEERQATPTAMLRQEHEVILQALGVLERLGQRLERGEPVAGVALNWLIDFFGHFVDRWHHGKEEQHLFPALERHGLPREQGPLAVMLHEHQDGRVLLGIIREGDDRRTAQAIKNYTRLLRAHIDKENWVLFPLAEQVLGDEEQQGLLKAFEAVEQAVAGPASREQLLAELAGLEGEGEPGRDEERV